jgi:hypothetical protein
MMAHLLVSMMLAVGQVEPGTAPPLAALGAPVDAMPDPGYLVPTTTAEPPPSNGVSWVYGAQHPAPRPVYLDPRTYPPSVPVPAPRNSASSETNGPGNGNANMNDNGNSNKKDAGNGGKQDDGNAEKQEEMGGHFLRRFIKAYCEPTAHR